MSIFIADKRNKRRERIKQHNGTHRRQAHLRDEVHNQPPAVMRLRFLRQVHVS